MLPPPDKAASKGSLVKSTRVTMVVSVIALNSDLLTAPRSFSFYGVGSCKLFFEVCLRG